MTNRVSGVKYDRPVSFSALAGAREVGRHSHLLRIGSINILFDPGLHNGANGHCANYKGINKIDYIFLTHAHTDHIGSLCEVMALFPKARVYATAATKHLVILALRHRGEEQKLNIAKCAAKITPVSYNQDLELKNRIEAVFIPAGHILGSASIIISTPEGKFMITGDYDITSRGILPPFVPPDIELRALISEGSFVGMQRPSPERERNRLIHLVTKEISAENRVIVAADSLGVFQEYAVYLAFLQTTGNIPQYRLLFNHWLDDSLDVFKRFSQLLEFDVQQNQWAGRFEPLGNISQKELVSDGPYCLFAGPSNLK
ncbi:MAG: MBL fold metallo-hydrolase, partial [Candidatus Margulisiibacteriota bacterium]